MYMIPCSLTLLVFTSSPPMILNLLLQPQPSPFHNHLNARKLPLFIQNNPASTTAPSDFADTTDVAMFANG